jgi:hypothetical protein
MLILDNAALDNTLESVQKLLGAPVDAIVTEAKRKSGRHFMDAVLSGVKGIFIRNLASSSVYQQLSKQSSMLGFGNAEVTLYRRHRSLEGTVTDVYNGPAMAGDICGTFESVERCSGEVEYDVAPGGVLHLSIRAGGERGRGATDPTGYTSVSGLPGHNIFELCPVCKGPLDIGRQYSFDMDRGVIEHLKTGHRVVMIGVISLRSLFDELESELGDEIPRLLMTIEKDRVRDIIAGRGKELDVSADGYLRYMRTLVLKGMGSAAEASVDGSTVKARVDNPYYEPLVAGFLAGFYEAASGSGSRVEWTPATHGYTEVSLAHA